MQGSDIDTRRGLVFFEGVVSNEIAIEAELDEFSQA